MRTASLVLGIIGGVFGLIAALLAMFVGGVGSALQDSSGHTVAGLGLAAFFIAVVGIVGGAVAPKYPRMAALLELVAGIAGFVAVSLFWILSGPLFLIGALLAFLGRKPKFADATSTMTGVPAS
ncbi:MAG TPA: DUF4064 domain-containing protein [Thermomicrobiaceae bacterium]|nr:DUF4064 domain-containing protein [Thermomicrobiaceae bacterium]